MNTTEELYNEYKEYCKNDKHPLPCIIWLKYKKKVNITEQLRKEWADMRGKE